MSLIGSVNYEILCKYLLKTYNNICMYKLIIKIYYKYLKIFWSIFVKIHLKLLGVKIGKNVTFFGFPVINLGKNSEIILMDNVTLCSDSRFTQIGINHPVILKTSDNAKLIIGKDTGISGGTIYANKKVKIGNECLIGADVKIFDTNFHSLKALNRRHNTKQEDISSKEIIIEDNCFIGTGAIILKGSLVKKDTVIPAKAIVREKK